MTMNNYSRIIATSRYARFIPEKNRRETWPETVDRGLRFITDHIFENYPDAIETWDDVFDNVRDKIVNLEVMPSMRLLMSAGEAAKKDNISIYNCSFLHVNTKRSFAEALYILMHGTGVGFSCERQEISKLPMVPENLKETEDVIIVADSKLGWAKAFNKLMYSLWEGDIPRIDYSRIRPAGSRLKTFGGRASGPEPLRELFDFVIKTFKGSLGRKLNSLEVHDIMCKIGEVVVVGGVRRSALISLSNLSDRRMREAKVGAWWEENPQRALANNSAVYTEKPDVETFIEEWLSLVKSKSGERGIFSRVAAGAQATRWGRRDPDASYGTNPCSEIILKDKEFCNLTEVVCRPEDKYDELKNKIEVAAIIGTIQSTFTKFNFLSEEWAKNCEDERLLGVSLTGIMDNPTLNGTKENNIALDLQGLRDHARKVNEKWAGVFGIKPSAAITAVKPSGTVSELVDSAPGIHPRFSRYYIRSIRQDNKDPLTTFLKGQGVYHEPDAIKPEHTTVFFFAKEAPEGSVFRNDRTALEQLEHWLLFQRHWCEHKPSITVYVKEHEWLEVGAWVYKHFDEVSGVSFLPYSDHTYKQAPFTEVSQREWEEFKQKTNHEIVWNEFVEEEDNTTASQELSCSASSGCSI